MTCTGSAPAAGEQGVGPLLGSDRIPVLESDTRLSGPVAAAPDGPYCVFAVVDFPPTITWPDGASVMRVRQAPGGTVATWEARYRTANGGELEFRSLDTAGSVIETSTGNASISGVAQAMLVFFLDADFAVHYLQVYYVDDGGQIQFNFSGSIGALGDATHAVEIQVAPLGGLTDLGIGQVGASTDVTFAHSLALGVDHSALLAFEGERAAARAARLTVDAGVAFTLIGDADDSEQMGPQDVPDTLGNALDETWRADAALLHDSRTELGLTFRTRASLYDQDIALTLDYQGAGELAPYLEPVDDDQLTRNDIEVKRKGGGARARAVDRDSRLGVADPPDGIGTYDEQVEVNVYTDEQIEHHAYWRLRVRTWDEVRYPRVELNMAAMAQAGKWDLISAICSLRVGDRIRLTNLPIWAGSSTVDLLYLGRSMRLGHPVEWEITLNCVPYGPYEVKRLGDNPPDVDALTGRLVGDDRCALRAAISETDTTIDFDSNFYRWTTLWLHDTASRTDGSGWGAPDIGPQWVDDASGGTASVAGGDLIHAMTMTDDYVSSVVDGLIVADVQVYLRGVHPASTPSGGSISGVVYLRTNMAGTNVHAGVTFAADGTATAFGDGSSVPRTSATIPGVTASESVDVLIQLVGPRLKVWAAPSSVGIDLEHAPLVSIAVAAMTANMLTVDTETDSGLSVPLAMHYGAVEITSPGSFVDDFPLPVMLMRSPAAKTSGGELISATRITTTEAAFVAAGTPAHDDNTAVVPVDYSGGAVGDWVMVVAAERDSTVELSISDGNYEYTLLCQHGGLYVWAAIRTADIPAPTITPSGGGSGDTVSAVMFGLRNMPVTLAPGQYVLDQAMRTNSSAQNIAYPGLPEGIYWGRVILLVARKSDDWTGVAPPTGFTEAVDSSTTSGDEQGIAVYYRIDESPSVVNPGSLAVTGGSSAASDVLVLALAGGYQTMTVDRAHNGIKKAHAAGTYLEVRDELVVAL